MGAGCYWTHPDTDLVASWVCFPDYDEERETKDALACDAEPRDEETFHGDSWLDIEDAIEVVMASLAYDRVDDAWSWCNNLAKVTFRSTHDATGMVVLFTCLDDSLRNLFDRNLTGMERKILSKFYNDYGYEVRHATSGYTSCEVAFDENGQYK